MKAIRRALAWLKAALAGGDPDHQRPVGKGW